MTSLTRVQAFVCGSFLAFGFFFFLRVCGVAPSSSALRERDQGVSPLFSVKGLRKTNSPKLLSLSTETTRAKEICGPVKKGSTLQTCDRRTMTYKCFGVFFQLCLLQKVNIYEEKNEASS